MRLITWNCANGKYELKRNKLLELQPDIAVIQEAGLSGTSFGKDHWFGANLSVGVGVINSNYYEIETFESYNSEMWSIIPLRIRRNIDFNLLAVWTRKDSRYIEGLNRALNIYESFLLEKPSIIIGDFNANAIWDNASNNYGINKVAQRMMQEYGLKSAYHHFFNESFGNETHPTRFHHRDRSKPYHVDYCFLPENWEIINVEIGDLNEWLSYSDHLPLIIDIDINKINFLENIDWHSQIVYSRKILLMVEELHRKGYQKLRIVPAISPTGMSWRCAILPSTSISLKHGAQEADYNTKGINYSSSQGNFFYDRKNALNESPIRLAEMFIEYYPGVADAGYGPDWQYAGWFQYMLNLTSPNNLPVAYAEYTKSTDQMLTIGENKDLTIPLPPPGHGTR